MLESMKLSLKYEVMATDSREPALACNDRTAPERVLFCSSTCGALFIRLA